MGEKKTSFDESPLILLEEESRSLEKLRSRLEAEGWEVKPFQDWKEAIAFLSGRSGSLILIDILFPGFREQKMLQTIRDIDPDSVTIAMTHTASLSLALETMEQGAYAYVLKPVNIEELKVVLKKAVRESHLSLENRKLIDRLQIINRNLEISNWRLSSLNGEMEDFLHVVSHDLMAPLINIQGFSTKLSGLIDSLGSGSQGHLSEEIETCIRFIQKGVKNMDSLIGGLLRISRIGRKVSVFQNNDLEKVMEDIQAIFEFEMKEHAVRFLRKKKFPVVWCRRDEISQVFSNLISNAIRYREPTHPSEIEISFEEEGDAYKFWVRDNGIGIDKKDQGRIFKLFERGAETPVKGEGLGLALVKKIVEQHDGKIWVESYKGRGATFYFTLPKQKGTG